MRRLFDPFGDANAHQIISLVLSITVLIGRLWSELDLQLKRQLWVDERRPSTMLKSVNLRVFCVKPLETLSTELFPRGTRTGRVSPWRDSSQAVGIPQLCRRILTNGYLHRIRNVVPSWRYDLLIDVILISINLVSTHCLNVGTRNHER